MWSQLFENINKINKVLSEVIRKKKTQVINSSNERENIITGLTDVERIIRDYWKPLCLVDPAIQMSCTNLFKDKDNSQSRHQKNNRCFHSSICIKEIEFVIAQR